MPLSQWTYYACWATLLVLYLVLRTIRVGVRKIPRLSTVTDHGIESLPSLTIVLAAKDEEKKIAACLDSLLEVEYPHLKILVVNDRSTDRTAKILEEYTDRKKVKVLTVDSLPKGWLGKNHALWLGAEQAHSDLLLFTDADVLFAPTSVKHAVYYLLHKNLDHVTVVPQMLSHGFLQTVTQDCFSLFLWIFAQPWKAIQPGKTALGIGAFNLLRKEAYEKIGTHEALRLNPLDDIRLGQLVKLAKLQQGVLRGGKMLRVEWYASTWDMAQGLTKNFFAAFRYNVALAVGFLVVVFWFALFPYLGLFLTRGFTPLVCLLCVWMLSRIYWVEGRNSSRPFYYAAGLPVGTALLLGMLVRSAAITLKTGGIRWRDTFYSLKDLKAALRKEHS